MRWNWERSHWPRFSYEAARLAPLEERFLLNAGELIGVLRHVADDELDTLRIDLIGEEAVKTAQIEGEILDRASVQSSLRRQFGLAGGDDVEPPAESGIAEMMIDLFRGFADPLRVETLFAWHRMLMRGRRDVRVVGGWRAHAEPMQVVSGPIHAPKVHFEAPPSARMAAEMAGFIAWFARTAKDAADPLPALTRAGIAHLYFVSIHPFEDGNGRIARALAEKCLAENVGQPCLIAVSETIERRRSAHYAALEAANSDIEITDWLLYFAETILTAQGRTMERVAFSLEKTKFYDRLSSQFNERQAKVIARMFREGIDGFAGGLSAENYIRIAKTSRPTATRDLQDLVAKRALTRTGELRHTRYRLSLSEKG